MLMKKLFLDFLGTTLCPCFVKAKLLRFSSPTKKNPHFSAELAVYRAVSAVAAPVLAVYNIRTSLIQRCISCISSDSIFW